MQKTESVSSAEDYTKGLPGNQAHYMGLVQPIELMQKIMTPEEFQGFLKGNAIKYAFRAGRKAGEAADKDLAKFVVYSQWLQDAREGKTIKP